MNDNKHWLELTAEELVIIRLMANANTVKHRFFGDIGLITPSCLKVLGIMLDRNGWTTPKVLEMERKMGGIE